MRLSSVLPSVRRKTSHEIGSVVLVSVKQFIEQLGNSGVMSERDIAAFVESLDTPPENGEALAKALIQQKKLTTDNKRIPTVDKVR